MQQNMVSERAFFGVSALLFVASAAVTIVWCVSMVGDGRDANARRLDHVHGVDADMRTDVARHCGLVHRHVGRNDDCDDAAIPRAHVVALPSGRRQGLARQGWIG